MCLAENSKGFMRTPCVIRIIPPTPPEPPKNCIVQALQIAEVLEVACDVGQSEGLEQTFHLEVLDSSLNDNIIAKLTSNSPQFKVTAGESVRIQIWAENELGESSKVFLDGITSRVAQLQTGDIMIFTH